MRKMNFFSGLFGLLGICAFVLGLVLAVGNRSSKPMLLTSPDAAQARLTQTMDALCRGDYETAGDNLYGTPDFGMGREAEDAVGDLIWNAFVESLSYELTGTCSVTDTGLAQTVVIRGMDIESVTATLGTRSRALLEQRVEEAKDFSEVYDENNEFREELVMEVLYEAAQQALEQDAQEKTWEVTVNLIYENGQWWVQPETALLQAVSGGMMK